MCHLEGKHSLLTKDTTVKELLGVKKLFILVYVTSKQEPYYKAKAILNSQNSGSNFESLKVTSEDSTLSEFVQT